MRYCGPERRWMSEWHQFNCLLDDYFKPILIFLFIIILTIFILKTFVKTLNNKNTQKISDRNNNLLTDYVSWYKKNKDEAASYVNSYSNDKFFIIKDQIGNVLEEVELKIAKYRVKGDVGDLDDLLTKYIEFHNKKSKKQADQMKSRKRGDDFILCDVNNQIIKKISVDDSFNELSYAKFVKEFYRRKRENLD
tara:strand:+ start:1252 stop:1830 length:579 start_codon:yes stop_codon:yes gene_type:complete